jgi:iron complex outermembrane receptor protein
VFLDRSEDPLPVLNFDADDAERSIVEPGINASLLYTATELDTFRLIYGRGALLPNVVELGAFLDFIETAFPLPGGGSLVIPGVATGNPQLDPTITNSVEVSYTRRIPQARAELSFAAFYQHHDNLQRNPLFRAEDFPNGLAGLTPMDFANFQSSPPVVPFTQFGTSEAYGFEASLQGAFSNVYYDINYTFLDVEDDASPPPALGVQPEEAVLPDGTLITSVAPRFDEATPEHEVNVTLGGRWWRLSGEVVGEWRSDYAPQQFLPSGFYTGFDIDSRFELGGRLAFEITDGIVAGLQVNNLFEDRWREAPTFEVERRIWFELSARG